MSDIVEPLTWKMTLEDGGFNVVAARAGQTLATLGRAFDASAVSAGRTEQAMAKVGSSFKDTVVTMGALRFALMDLDDFLLSFPKSIAKAGGEFQRLQTLMEGLSKSSDDTVKKVEAVRDVMNVIGLAKTAPFDVKSLSDAFVKFKSAGLDPANGSLSALVSSVAKFGGSSETLQRASVAIQQMMGKGVVSMEELRQQLGEAVPNAMQLMARGMGLSIAELTDKVSKGVVKSETALARMFAQMQLDAQGATEALMKTLPGALSRLKTEYELFQKSVADQGFTATLTSITNELTAAFDSNEGRRFAKEVGVALREVTEQLIVMGRWIFDNTGLLANMGLALLSALGGSKLSNAYTGIRDRMEGVKAQQQSLVDQANAATRKEVEGLRSKGDEIQKNVNKAKIALEQGIRDRQEALGKELQSFNAYKDKQVQGLVDIRNQKRADAAEAMAQLKELQAAQNQANANLKKLEAGMSQGPAKNPLGAPQRFGPDAGSGYMPAMDTVQKALATDRVKQIEAEIVAQKNLVQTRVEALRQSGDLIAAKSAEKMAGSLNVKTLEDELQKQKDLLRANEQVISSKRTLTTVSSTAGAALMGFGRTLLAGLGWAAAFALAVEGIVYVFGMFTRKAREAEAAQQALNRAKLGMSVDDDPKVLQKQVDSLKQDLKEREATKRKFDENKGLAKSVGPDAVSQLDFDIAALKRKIEDGERGLRDATKNVAVNKVLSESQSVLSAIDKEVAVALSKDPMNGKYKQLAKDISDAGTSASKEQQAEFAKRDVALTKERASREAELYGDISKKKLDGLKGADKDLLAAIEDGTTRQGAALLKRAATTNSDDLYTKPKKTPKAPNDKSSFETFMEAQKEEATKLKQDAKIYEDGIITVKEIQDRARALIDQMSAPDDKGRAKLMEKNKGSGTPRLLNEGEKQSAADIMAQNDMAKEADKVRAKLQPALAALQAEEERYQDVFSGEILFKPSKEVKAADALLKQFEPWQEVLQQQLSVAGMTWEQFKNKMKMTSAMIGVGEATNDLNKKIRALEDDAVTDAELRQRIITKNLIEEESNRVNATAAAVLARGTLNEEEAAKLRSMYEKLGIFINGQQAALTTKTRSAAQVMADEWKNGMKAMEQASTSWMTNFVDQLVDGTLSVKDFVTGVIKDIAKIKIKDMLGNGGIGDSLESGTTALGNMLGLHGNGVRGGLPIDSLTNAMRVVNVDTLNPLAKNGQGNLLDEARKGWDQTAKTAQEMFTKAGTQLSTVFNQLKEGFSDLGRSIANALGGEGSSAGGFFGKLFGSFSGNQATAGGSYSGTGIGGEGVSDAVAGFANGGIMTSAGALSLKKYANGGIANSPQLAMFGEGSKPEAYVPLPDGRSIPVSLQGNTGQQAAQQMPSVQVNVINSSGTAVKAEQQGQPRFDGKQMVLDVVLQAMNEPGSFRNGMKESVK